VPWVPRSAARRGEENQHLLTQLAMVINSVIGDHAVHRNAILTKVKS
jgi:hypothetical protein